eukprot:c5423_g1_i1 orf=2-193(-)
MEGFLKAKLPRLIKISNLELEHYHTKEEHARVITTIISSVAGNGQKSVMQDEEYELTSGLEFTN